MELNNVTNDVLNVIDSYGFKQEGAYNLRLNGMAVCHGDSRHIQIVKKEDQPGIDIHISGEAKNEQVHIPVVMTEAGVDVVYNDFYIEDGADVTIVATCVSKGRRIWKCKICGKSLCRWKRNREKSIESRDKDLRRRGFCVYAGDNADQRCRFYKAGELYRAGGECEIKCDREAYDS